ncbi:hypothetical protein HK101_006287, partial [Irineochytrium annulatum]
MSDPDNAPDFPGSHPHAFGSRNEPEKAHSSSSFNRRVAQQEPILDDDEEADTSAILLDLDEPRKPQAKEAPRKVESEDEYFGAEE